jgi:hypothetical protein
MCLERLSWRSKGLPHIKFQIGPDGDGCGDTDDTEEGQIRDGSTRLCGIRYFRLRINEMRGSTARVARAS